MSIYAQGSRYYWVVPFRCLSVIPFHVLLNIPSHVSNFVMRACFTLLKIGNEMLQEETHGDLLPVYTQLLASLGSGLTQYSPWVECLLEIFMVDIVFLARTRPPTQPWTSIGVKTCVGAGFFQLVCTMEWLLVTGNMCRVTMKRWQDDRIWTLEETLRTYSASTPKTFNDGHEGKCSSRNLASCCVRDRCKRRRFRQVYFSLGEIQTSTCWIFVHFLEQADPQRKKLWVPNCSLHRLEE